MSFVNIFWQRRILLTNVSLILQWSSGAPIFVLASRAKGDILNIASAEVNVLIAWLTVNSILIWSKLRMLFHKTEVAVCCQRFLLGNASRTSVRWKRSAFHKVVWRFSGVVDKFISIHVICHQDSTDQHTHTHTRLVALFPGLPGWAGIPER